MIGLARVCLRLSRISGGEPRTCFSIGIELGDPANGLGCVGRIGRGEEVVELAPCVGPAGCFGDPASVVERMKSRIRVGLEGSVKALEMSLRMFSAAVGREGEPYRRRNRIGARTAIAYIGPEPAGLGSSVAGGEHRNGRVVGMKSHNAS